jgi:hypothetical protein
VDEAQDTSEVMLSIVNQQPADKVTAYHRPGEWGLCASLATMIQLVTQYGRKLFEFDRIIKQRLVEKDRAECVFATTHKAKGQEYDHVEMVEEDFITREGIKWALRAGEDKASTPQAARGNQHLLRRGDASQKIDSFGQLLMAMRSSGCGLTCRC